MATTIHQLSVQDRRALIPALTADGAEPAQIMEELEEASIIRFEGYGKGFDGYCGPVTVIVWAGGPGQVSVLTKGVDGAWQVVKPSAADAAGGQIQALVEQYGGSAGYWGEHPDYPRSDWKYLVSNDEELNGYWVWLAKQLEEAVNDVA